MKHLCLLALLACATLSGRSQSLGPQVISAAGAFTSQLDVSLSYTVGEIASATLISPSAILTQGFQQPEPLKVSVTDPVPLFFDLTAYPNPSSHNLVVQTHDARVLSLGVFNALGQIVETPRAADMHGGATLDVSHLAPGLYTLQVAIHASSSDRLLRTSFMVVH